MKKKLQNSTKGNKRFKAVQGLNRSKNREIELRNIEDQRKENKKVFNRRN